ncbi:MAG TPA: ribonuclease P protein component [Ignavibacteriaceae bacterium]
MTNGKKSVKPVKKKIVLGRLILKSDFELVYKMGRVVISEDNKIKVKFFFTNKEKSNSVKIGLSIASKKGNSVWRNRIKRILRESIRINRDILRNILEEKNTDLLIIFSPYSINQTNSKKIFLRNIEPAVLETIKKIGK